MALKTVFFVIFSCLPLHIWADNKLSEDLRYLDFSLDQSLEELAEAPQDPNEDAGDRYFRESFEYDLRRLKTAGVDRLLAMNSPVGRSDIEALELYFANLLCRYVFTDKSTDVIKAMNRLYLNRTNQMHEYGRWIHLVRSAQGLLEVLPSESSSRVLEEARRSTSDFVLELQNLLFNNIATECLRPQDRKPRSLKQMMTGSVGFRSPQTKYHLMYFHLQQWLKTSHSPETEEQVNRMAIVMSDYLAPRSPSIQSNQRSSRQLKNYLSQVEGFRFDVGEVFQADGSPAVNFRVELASIVYDVYGAPREVVIPVSPLFVFSTEVRQSSLVAALHETDFFDRMNSASLRITAYEEGEDFKRIGYLDFRLTRNMTTGRWMLAASPRYRHFDSEHDAKALSYVRTKDIKAAPINYSVFLEDLSELEVIPDEIKIFDPRGEILRVEKTYRLANIEQKKLIESFHVATDRQDLEELKYDRSSELSLLFRLRVKALEPI